MGKFLFAVVAAVASLVLSESLICNRCSFGLLGVCLNMANQTCEVNTSVCYTQRTTFTVLPDFAGFNTQGCKDNDTGCNEIITGNMMSAEYKMNTTCCSTDNCNTISLNGAPSTKMTFTTTIGAALLASVWRSIL